MKPAYLPWGREHGGSAEMSPIDPVTGLEAGSGLLTLSLAKSILGPSAKRIGEALDRYTDYRTRNVGRIMEKAAGKLGDELQAAGEVHPRVAYKLLEEGSWCDDELTQDYFAGVLAASRQNESADDRGASWAEVVSSLSAYQLRAHYITYSTLRRLGKGQPNMGIHDDAARRKAIVNMDAVEFIRACYVTDVDVVTHAITGLVRIGLLGLNWGVGQPKKLLGDEPQPAVHAEPSLPGSELFLWAHGIRPEDLSHQLFTEPDEAFVIESAPPTIEAARLGA